MLYDPKWNRPSLAGFAAWLRTQPRDTVFNYQLCDNCAAAQYLHAIGQFQKGWVVKDWNLNWPAAGAFVRAKELGVQPTFGMVLDEIENPTELTPAA